MYSFERTVTSKYHIIEGWGYSDKGYGTALCGYHPHGGQYAYVIHMPNLADSRLCRHCLNRYEG